MENQTIGMDQFCGTKFWVSVREGSGTMSRVLFAFHPFVPFLPFVPDFLAAGVLEGQPRSERLLNDGHLIRVLLLLLLVVPLWNSIPHIEWIAIDTQVNRSTVSRFRRARVLSTPTLSCQPGEAERNVITSGIVLLLDSDHVISP